MQTIYIKSENHCTHELSQANVYTHWWVFLIGNQVKFLANSSVHSTNTRNKHHLHRPIANLSCFQKGASYSGIRIFNNLPQSIISLRNEKPQFKVVLKNCYVRTPFTLWMNFLHVQMICIAGLHDCVNSYTVIILCLWNVPHTIVWWQPQGSMECVCVCIYIYIYIYIYVSAISRRPQDNIHTEDYKINTSNSHTQCEKQIMSYNYKNVHTIDKATLTFSWIKFTDLSHLYLYLPFLRVPSGSHSRTLPWHSTPWHSNHLSKPSEPFFFG